MISAISIWDFLILSANRIKNRFFSKSHYRISKDLQQVFDISVFCMINKKHPTSAEIRRVEAFSFSLNSFYAWILCGYRRKQQTCNDLSIEFFPLPGAICRWAVIIYGVTHSSFLHLFIGTPRDQYSADPRDNSRCLFGVYLVFISIRRYKQLFSDTPQKRLKHWL